VARRTGISLAMLATGGVLLISVQLAPGAAERRGGIFRVGTIGAWVEVDPQVAYITTSWWMQYATAAKLYNYRPGGKLVPEVASRFRVANGGKRYTFVIRKGFRFSDGEPVTPSSFKYAINRAANQDLASPALQFITHIVGVEDVNERRATEVRGVRVRGSRLIIDLTRADGSFISILTLPFFQATSTKLPLDREVFRVENMNDLPSAGPYVFTFNEANRTTSLRRNPYWTRGPGRTAPRNLDGVDILWNLNEEAAFEMVERGELDEGPVPAAHAQEVVNRYGLNRTRFWSIPGTCTGWVIFNNRRPLFRNNVRLRQAINWALDRRAYAGLAAPFAATPWTHLLPPSFPGSITRPELQPYAAGPDLEKARALAAGHFRDGRITVVYRNFASMGSAQAELVRRDLTLLGFDPGNIELRGYKFPPPRWDLQVGWGWCGDYPDPLTFFAPFAAPDGPELPFSFPAPSLDDPAYQEKIATAARLSGKARLKAFGKLDLDLMRNLAPVAAMRTYNDRFFFSDRVDPRSLSFHRVYPGWSIPAVALK
jgi:ABC-type oligopeptide transport system substrate-binding subunit